MSIAHTVQTYLTQHQIPFTVVEHAPTVSSLRTAHSAHIKAGTLAKAVLLEDEFRHGHYMLAVVPATRRVDIGRLAQQAGRPLRLASEEAAAGLFQDCATGAIPPVGPAYGVETVWDESLMQQSEIYCEAGDHEHLLRLQAGELLRLLPGCAHGAFSNPL